jgi:nucleotide-binding universal stress UspA family protein
MKILLAIDDSAGSRAAIEAVGRRACPAGSTVVMLSAYEARLEPMARPWLLPRDEKQFLEVKKEQAQALVEAAAEKLRKQAGRNLKVKTMVAQGRPARVILEQAERAGADLIVLGSHGHTAWERIILGATAHAVALHAKCSVEIVRRRKRHR